jgi:hypothetical protein
MYNREGDRYASIEPDHRLRCKRPGSASGVHYCTLAGGDILHTKY